MANPISRNQWDTVAIPGMTVSAGPSSATLSAVTFSNSNGVSFGLNAGVITASISVTGGGAGSLSLSDSATSLAVSQLAFTNSNGITMTLSTAPGVATLIASYTVPTVTNSSWTVSDVATSATVGRLAFTNSNGLTLSLLTSNNGNHTVVGSYTVPTVTNSSWTVSDAATSGTVAQLAFTNSNGLTLSLITSNNGHHTVVGSYTVPSTAGLISAVKFSAGTLSSNRTDVTFSNSNGVGFGLDTNGVITASYTVPTVTNSSWTVSDSATSATVAQLAFTASNGLTLTLSTSNNGHHTVIGSYTVPTVTNSSWTVSDSTTSATVGRLAFVNSNGVSFGLVISNNGNQTVTGTVATNYAGQGFTTATTAGVAIVGTLSTNGLSLGVPNYLTTATASAAIEFSASNTSFNLGAINFSASNGISFGLGTGANSTVMTASVADANNISIANSQTTFATGQVNFMEGGGAITIASSGGGQSLKFSVPATSSLVATWGVGISTNGSTITISEIACQPWLEPYSMTNTALFGPTAGSWYLAPFCLPHPVSGGRINLLHQNTSTAALFRDITGASYHSGSTGTLNQSYTYSKAVALWSQGSGTNSTRLESLWSNSFSFGWSKVVNVSLSQASNINVSVAHSLSYISEIGSDGAYTLNQFASSRASSMGNSSTASNWGDSIAGSIRSVLSNSIIEPIGLNTTLAPGFYWFGFAWSTTRATASTGGALASALDFAVSSEVGISRLLLESAYRNWGSTVTTARSHIMPYGVYTGAANMAPPQYIALSSDLSSLGSAWVPYFNMQYNGITKG